MDWAIQPPGATPRPRAAGPGRTRECSRNRAIVSAEYDALQVLHAEDARGVRMNKSWAGIRTIGLVAIVGTTIACVSLVAFVAVSIPVIDSGPEIMRLAEGNWILKETTWGPWTQATSCPWHSATSRWSPARVRLGRVVHERSEATFWQVDGQPNQVYHYRGTPRVEVYLRAGGVTVGTGIILAFLWYIIATRLGKDRTNPMNGQDGGLARTKANACFALLHCVSVVLGFVGVHLLWHMEGLGKGWWFSYKHMGVLLLGSILANVAVGWLVFARKRQTVPVTAMSVLSLLTLALACLQGFGIVDL